MKGCVSKVVTSLYGLKNASLNWFEKLKQILKDRNFRQSNIDSCVFIRGNCIILVYVDDCIIVSPDENVINRFIKSMQDGQEHVMLTDKGDLARLLRVEIEYKEDRSIEMIQSHLILRILDLCGIYSDKVNGRDTLVGKSLLHKDLKGLPRK